MTACQDGNQQLLDHLVLAHNDLSHLSPDLGAGLDKQRGTLLITAPIARYIVPVVAPFVAMHDFVHARNPLSGLETVRSYPHRPLHANRSTALPPRGSL
jgi:hypothetical protein